MRLATRPRVLAALATSAALVATGVVAAPAAQAGPPGHWTLLSKGTHLGTIQEPGIVRSGKDLVVVWTQEDSASKNSVQSRIVHLNGSTGALHAVVSNWASLNLDPTPIVTGGHLLTAFAGQRTLNPSEKYRGEMVYATSPTGTAWTLGTGSLSKDNSAGSYGTDAVDDAGTPVIATVASSAARITLHRGIDTIPASNNDYFSTANGGCCAYSVALARDTKTHAIYTAWYSNASGGKEGTWVQPVAPGANGALKKAPGSYTTGTYTGSIPPNGELAMVAGPRGGIYLAYGVGYPTVTKVRVWKVGASTYHDFPANNAHAIALGASLNGGIWVAWSDPATSTVRAVRSNKTVTKFGAIRSTAFPKSGGNVGYVYSMAIDGSKGPLDIVVNSTVPGKTYDGIYHTQIYAPLKVTVSPSSVKSSKGGSVTVQVTEAGSAIVGAKVSFAGKAYKTNSHGKVTLKIAKHTATGKKTVTVSLTYYVTTKVTVRVT